jgi:hypothetical protein
LQQVTGGTSTSVVRELFNKPSKQVKKLNAVQIDRNSIYFDKAENTNKTSSNTAYGVPFLDKN